MRKIFRSISMLMIVAMMISSAALVSVSAAVPTGTDFAEDFASWGWVVNDPHDVSDVQTKSEGISVVGADENIKAVVNGDMDLQVYGGSGKINLAVNSTAVGTVTVNLKAKPTMSAETGFVYVNSTNSSSAAVSNKLFKMSNTNPYMILGETSPLIVKNNWGTGDAGAKAKDEAGYVPIEIVFERRNANFDWDIKVFNKAYSTTEPVITGKAPKADYPTIEGLSIDTASGSWIYFDSYSVKHEPVGIDFTEDFASWGWTVNAAYNVTEFANEDTNISVDTTDAMQAYMNASYDLFIYNGAGFIDFNAGGASSGKVTLNLRVKSTYSGDIGHVYLNSVKASETVRNKLFRIQSGTYGLLGLNTTAETLPLSVKASWGSGDAGAKAYDSEGYVPVEIVIERRNENSDWDIKVYNKAYSTTEPVITGKAPKADYPTIEGIGVGTASGKYLQIDSYSVKYTPAGIDFTEDFSKWGWAYNTDKVDELKNVDTNISVDSDTSDVKVYLTGSNDLQIGGGTGKINFAINGAETGKFIVNLRVNPAVTGNGDVNIISKNGSIRNPLFKIPGSGYAIGGANGDTSKLSVQYSWGDGYIGTTAKDGNYVPIEIVFERPNTDSDWDIKVYNKAYSKTSPVITAKAPSADYPTIEGLSVDITGGWIYVNSFSIANVPTYISRLTLNSGASTNLTGYTGDLDYSVNATTDSYAKVIVALYDGNTLEDTKIHDVEDAKQLDVSGTFEATNLTNGSVKAFLWNGFEDIVPLDVALFN